MEGRHLKLGLRVVRVKTASFKGETAEEEEFPPTLWLITNISLWRRIRRKEKYFEYIYKKSIQNLKEYRE